jgi:hypothetical protein
MLQADALVMDARNRLTQIGAMCSFKFLMRQSREFLISMRCPAADDRLSSL